MLVFNTGQVLVFVLEFDTPGLDTTAEIWRAALFVS